jgi:hypothetical protein
MFFVQLRIAPQNPKTPYFEILRGKLGIELKMKINYQTSCFLLLFANLLEHFLQYLCLFD